MKIGKLIIGALVALAIHADAASVIASSSPALTGGAGDFFIMNTGGTLLSSGVAASGRFSLSDADVALLAAGGNLSALASAFSTGIGTDNFVTGVTDQLGFAVPGLYFINNTNFDAASYVGSTVYTMIGNGTTFGNSTQFALIRHPGIVRCRSSATCSSASIRIGREHWEFGSCGNLNDHDSHQSGFRP